MVGRGGVRLSPPARHTICSVRSAQTGVLCFFSSPSLPSSADTSLQASGVVRDRYQIFRWRVHSSDDYNNSSWKMWVCLFVVYLCLISHWEFCNDTKVFSRKHAWCCADLIIFSVIRRMLFGTNLNHLKTMGVTFLFTQLLRRFVKKLPGYIHELFLKCHLIFISHT